MEGLEKFLTLQMQNMQLLTEQLLDLQEKVADGTTNNSSHIPWPKPLQVDTGDIQQSFELFKSNWEAYVIATGMDKWDITKEQKKVNILLTIIGDAAKVKYNNFDITDQDKTSVQAVLDKICDQLAIRKHSMYERWLFHTCNQLPDENFDTYLVRLTKIVDKCQFDNIDPRLIKETMLRDRIAFGIKDADLKKKFLKIIPEKITLRDVVDQCKIQEITEDRFREIKKEDKVVNKVFNKSNQLRTCKFCIKKHVFERDACPARDHKCKICNFKGHLEKACYKKTRQKQKEYKTKTVKEIGNESDSSENEENLQVILKVMDNTMNGGTINVTLKFRINNVWKDIKCDLDTGAGVCIVGCNYLYNMFDNNNPELSETNYKLKSFGGSIINTKGQIMLICKYKTCKYKILFQVVDGNHGPLLSANACISLGLIKCCNAIDLDNSKCENNIKFYRDGAESIIEEFQDIFKGQGVLDGEVELEVDEQVIPVIQSARRIPMNLKHKLKQELDRLVQQKIIIKEEQHTEWVSNILLVQKKDSFRICLDPIPLNKALKRPHFQFNTIDEILPELGKAKVFTTLDTKKGFWHLKLTERSSKLTCFWTPFGRYRWLRLPFGIAPAPELFTMKIQQLLENLSGVEVMADDILVYGSGNDMSEAMIDHNRNLRNLLIRLRKHNIRLNKSKLSICQTSIKFYGHILTNEGLKPDISKVIAIKDMPEPKNKADLQRFLGMINYLSRFIKHLSSKTIHLRKLVLENAIWIWTETEIAEFNKLKETVSNIETLKYFELNKPITMECDASSSGLGVALFQGDGIIAYASRTLTKSECNYAMIEKELLAIVFGCTRFDKFIIGNPELTIKTDHKPLLAIFNKPLLKAPKRLQAMLMTLQRYNVKLKFVQGKDNIVADTLSRAAIEDKELSFSKKDEHVFRISTLEKQTCANLENINLINNLSISDERIEIIKRNTSLDHILQKLINLIINGWPRYIQDVPDELRIYNKYKHELSVQNGLIFRRERILIPYNLRKTMKEKVHSAHNGIENTLKLAKQNLFWPGMTNEITEIVRNCEACKKYAQSQSKLPMMSAPIPSYPWQIISMDVCFVEYLGKQQKTLIVVDHYSDYFEALFLKDLTPISVINNLKQTFSRFGIPGLLISDQGTNFVNKEMKDFAYKYQFDHVTSSPYHKQSNGKAEATVKIFKNIVKKCNESNEDLWWALLHWRNTPNKIGSSPIQRIMSRQTRHSIPSVNLKPTIIDKVPEQIIEKRRMDKSYYDKKTKVLPDLQIGDKVKAQIRPDTHKKWTSGIILEKLSDRSYIVEANGGCYQRNRGYIKDDFNVEPAQPEEQRVHSESESLKLSDNGDQCKQHLGQEAHEEETIEDSSTDRVRPQRTRKLPAKFKDYILV